MDETCRLARADVAASKSGRGAKILVVTPVGLAGRGGIDRLNLYLHDYLFARGAGGRLGFIASRGERRAPFWLLTFGAALLRFAYACLTRRCDLAHIHVSTDGSTLRKLAFGGVARAFGLPYVIQFHGMMSEEIERARQPWFRALSLLSRGASCVIVLGEAYRAPFERMGVRPERIRVVHNGIPDIGAQAVVPRPAGDVVNILFSGELAERKGAHLLIAALSQIKSVETPWRCTIAGNGDMAALQAMAHAAGVADRVEFTGWIDIGRVHELMRAADVVVLPSRAEALPLALIEGASAGAALVATDVGAVRDVVLDGANGLIVERDAARIAEALARLIADTGVRQDMQTASRRLYRERFQIAHFAASICAAHEKCRRA